MNSTNFSNLSLFVVAVVVLLSLILCLRFRCECMTVCYFLFAAVVYERANGIKQCMQTTFANLEESSIERCSHKYFKPLLYVLTFFHASMQVSNSYIYILQYNIHTLIQLTLALAHHHYQHPNKNVSLTPTVFVLVLALAVLPHECLALSGIINLKARNS